MTKKQMIENLAQKLVMTKVNTGEIIDFIFDSIKDQIRNQEEVSIGGFGTFKVKNVKERQARNPKTGEKVLVPAKSKVVFKPSKQLKELVNLN